MPRDRDPFAEPAHWWCPTSVGRDEVTRNATRNAAAQEQPQVVHVHPNGQRCAIDGGCYIVQPDGHQDTWPPLDRALLEAPHPKPPAAPEAYLGTVSGFLDVDVDQANGYGHPVPGGPSHRPDPPAEPRPYVGRVPLQPVAGDGHGHAITGEHLAALAARAARAIGAGALSVTPEELVAVCHDAQQYHRLTTDQR